MMKNSGKAFIQAYNAQAIVDSESQIIIAADLTNQASDVTHLPDMVKQVELNLNRKPKKASLSCKDRMRRKLRTVRGRKAYVSLCFEANQRCGQSG